MAPFIDALLTCMTYIYEILNVSEILGIIHLYMLKEKLISI